MRTDFGVKPSKNESVVIRETLQIDVQKLESEEQPASQEREQKMQEALSDSKRETQEAPSDPEDDGEASYSGKINQLDKSALTSLIG